MVDVVVQVVALVWAEDPAVVDVVVQVLVVVLVVEEVLWVEVRVVVEECSDTYKDHLRKFDTFHYFCHVVHFLHVVFLLTN